MTMRAGAEKGGGPGRHAVLAAGGTGGHMFPAEALAVELLARGWHVSLMTDARGVRYAGGFPETVPRIVVRSGTWAGRGPVRRLLAPFHLAAGMAAALMRFRRARPDVVVGFGGYPAFPAMAAATLLGIPRVIHEQNGVLGRVNRLFARRVDALALGMWPTELPEGVTGVHVGNPVRAAIRARAGAPYMPPEAGPISLLVTGGSQGARVLSDVLPAALAALPEELRARLRVAQQVRPEDLARVEAAHRAAGMHAEIAPFFDDMARRLAEAQLVIARAGASTVSEINVIGRPAIYVPLAIATHDHQSANARGPAEAGAAVVVPESEFTPERLRQEIADILGDPSRAAAMAAAALALGRPDAAEELADLVTDVAAGRSVTATTA